MNDILKYWPIGYRYNGNNFSVLLGEIVAIEQRTDRGVIHMRGGDTWTTDTPYDELMAQWKKAFNSLGAGLYL